MIFLFTLLLSSAVYLHFSECAENPCLNGGSCENGFNEFICKCKEGYEGRRCEQEVNLCKSNPCQHGGLCQKHFNSYTCQCQAGFQGKNCEVNVDDCLLRWEKNNFLKEDCFWTKQNY